MSKDFARKNISNHLNLMSEDFARKQRITIQFNVQRFFKKAKE